MKSVADSVKVVPAINPTAAANGAVASAVTVVVDTFGYNSALYNLQIGTPTGTTIDITVIAKVQECATSTGTFADFPTTGSATGTAVAAALATFGTASGTARSIRVEISPARLRYQKLNVSLSGTPTDKTLPVCGVAILGRAFQDPSSNP